jgi:hypothetical protein
MNLQTAQTNRDSANVVNAAGVLLRSLIDYAGLFPPASLPMAAAVANFEAYSQSEWRWIPGNFVVPVARLSEFEKEFLQLPAVPPGTNPTKWRLSALLGSDAIADAGRIHEFNVRMASHSFGRTGTVNSVEVKVDSAAEINRVSAVIGNEIACYFEFPPAKAAECVAAIAKCNRRAKIRTGGETADKFPSAASVIDFIRLCAASRVPFKATAGLHHPLRSIHDFTYQAGSPSGLMHGFLNVFLAAAFLWAGMSDEDAVHMLEDRVPDAFHFGADGVEWQAHRVSLQQIVDARRDFAISFGSCSFTEPIDDLRSLCLL